MGEIDLNKLKLQSIGVCPGCGRIVRMRKDHHHAEIICEKCGCVIESFQISDEMPEICVSERELEIELNTYRLSPTSNEKTRVGNLTRYGYLIKRYDRSTEGNMKKWRDQRYKDYIGIVNTHFNMTKTQKGRVESVINQYEDLGDLHGNAGYECIVTALCILSMKKDKRRISFDNKGMNKTQRNFIKEVGLTERKYITIIENCNVPMPGPRNRNK